MKKLKAFWCSTTNVVKKGCPVCNRVSPCKIVRFVNRVNQGQLYGIRTLLPFHALMDIQGGGNNPPPPIEIDADNDGWTVENGDCDDGDPNVYPGHQDSKGRWGRDGVDNDCNGITDG